MAGPIILPILKVERLRSEMDRALLKATQIEIGSQDLSTQICPVNFQDTLPIYSVLLDK